MALIGSHLNTAFIALTDACVPTMSQTGTALMTAVALQLTYPIAEWTGRQIPPIPKEKVIIHLSKLYFKLIEKKLTSPILKREYDFWQRTFNRLVAGLPNPPLNLRQRIHHLGTFFSQRALVAPPISTTLVSPIAEEVAFRGPLLFTSGISDVILTFTLSLLFAEAHAHSPDIPDQPGRVAALFVMGLTFALLTNFTGEIKVAILAHIFYNLINFLISLQPG